ncbi:MAG: M16 family metallopeptidase [Microbacter sp.]
MYYLSHTLSNGLRMVHFPDERPVAYCGFAVNVGTRDESANQHGLAHFVEHMLFKGTTRRKAWHILNSMDADGGELNAFTTKEETFVYAVFLENAFEKAIDLLSDMIVNPTFPPKEMMKEAEIILDEIESYNDAPSELIFDEAEGFLFHPYPMGRSILGTRKSVASFSQDDLMEFHSKFYRSDRMIFFSLGKTDFKKIIRWGEKYLVSIPPSDGSYQRITPENYLPSHQTLRKKTSQVHYILGNRAYSMVHPNRTAFYLLNNILGGPGMNSRLNLALRERSGLVYNVESTFTSYSDVGAFFVYFGTDPKHLNQCEDLVKQILNQLKDELLTAHQLSKSKHQLLGQLAIASENKENVALSFGRSMLHLGFFESLDDIMADLNKVTPEDVQQVAQEVFNEEQFSSLIYRTNKDS